MRVVVKQLEYDVEAPDGTKYWPQVIAEQAGNEWHGHILFTPLVKGEPLMGPRETTQARQSDVEYWATGLQPIWFEGAFERAWRHNYEPTATTTSEVDARDYIGRLNTRAEVLREMGDLENAMATARRVLGVSPQHPDALWVLAIAHAQRGDRAAAKSCIRQFLTVAPIDDPRRPDAEDLLEEVRDAMARAAGM